jgi:hypothetical protein
MSPSLSLPLRAAAAAALAALALGAPSAKRGYVAASCPQAGACDGDRALLSGAAWEYSYNYGPVYGGPVDPTFVPMSWCVKDVAKSVPGGVNTSFFLGFNEPNDVHQCNTSPAAAAAAWKDVMAKFPAAALVSPATAGDGTSWYAAFLSNCTALYGASGCRLSALATHDYTCDTGTLMAYVEGLYNRFKLPVWLTEWACGDGAAGRPAARHLAYMKAAVPLLDASPAVARYAWFAGRTKAGDARALVEGTGGAAKLTPLGEAYNTL